MKGKQCGRRTINKAPKDGVGVVFGVMAGAVAALPALEETPPFSVKEKSGAPLVILTASL